MRRINLMIVTALLLLSAAAGAGEQQETATLSTVGETFPALASGALTKATLTALPEGVLLRAEGVKIDSAAIESQIAQASSEMRQQLEKNRLFLLENLATGQLLLQAARQAGKFKDGDDAQEAIQAYLQEVASSAEVTDEAVKIFYDENKTMFSGMTLAQVKENLKQYLLQQEQQEAVAEYIRTLGDRMEIQINRAWTEAQATLAMDNPVDQARNSGKPSMVDFGAHGCGPCDMMTPILASMEEKYAGKANVLFVPVREERMLGARYGIRSIPVQVFFDQDGKEIFRHTGFFPQEECEKWLQKAGGE